MANKRKSELLGMSFGTAKSRLDRDLLFNLAVSAGHKCSRCGKDLTREDFSVDHISPWMRAEDPKAAFFDPKNIAFSHHHCNTMEMIERKRIPIEEKREKHRVRESGYYTPERRRQKYLRTGQ